MDGFDAVPSRPCFGGIVCCQYKPGQGGGYAMRRHLEKELGMERAALLAGLMFQRTRGSVKPARRCCNGPEASFACGDAIADLSGTVCSPSPERWHRLRFPWRRARTS